VNEADGVFQGGGVKGIALVGALIEFGKRGWTDWINVAGTSAGSIIAAYIACGHDVADLEKLLRETPYAQFEDFGAGGKLLGGGKNLKLIAADVTNRELLVLPEDLAAYRMPGAETPIDPDSFKVADAARMSMSIPYFFQPIELVRIDTGNTATIVDGGMLSNFPVWLFDVEDRDPKRPTFGFRLVGGKGVGGGMQAIVNGLGWPVQLGADMFHTAMEAWDKRFTSHSTYVRTCAVSAGEVGSTDFNLTPAQQEWLLSSGSKAAGDFLDQFRLEDYFNTFGRKLEPQATHV
jgi:NTE family protein